MRFIKSGLIAAQVVALTGFCALPLQAQTASEVTPESFTPDLQRLNGSVVFTGQAGTKAPPGSEDIGITLSGVDLENGLPQMAAENAAFVEQLTSGRIAVSELFNATSALEVAYARAGFVLTRVVLPQQSLRDGGRLRVTVVDGFVEAINTDDVPENIRPRVERLTEQLINRGSLTRAELERQLLLAGDVPGTALSSALAAGDAPGATVIGLAPEYRPVTGFVGLGNPNGDSLGGFNLDLGVEMNSMLGWGETFYLRLSGSPTQVFTSDPRSRILAGGAVLPIGYSGASVNLEVTSSDTTPDNFIATRSDFDRQSLRLIYPFVRGRQLNVTGQFSLDRSEDTQALLASGTPIFLDKLTVLRAGTTLSRLGENGSYTTAGVVVSRGLDALGARTLAEASGGTPLSRSGADATFSKLAISASHRQALAGNLSLAVSARAQSSFGDPLLTSEQFSVVGGQELSAFDSGSLRGDSGWVLRTELAKLYAVSTGAGNFTLSPYLFAGAGRVLIENPTVLEQGQTKAHSYGLGLDIIRETNSNYRSTSLRLEYGRGERDDAIPDENRFSMSANFRF